MPAENLVDLSPVENPPGMAAVAPPDIDPAVWHQKFGRELGLLTDTEEAKQIARRWHKHIVHACRWGRDPVLTAGDIYEKHQYNTVQKKQKQQRLQLSRLDRR